MKRLLLAFFGLLGPALAADSGPKWAVIADLKIVSLPLELSPAIVVQLNDPATVEAGHARLRTLIQEGRALLIHWNRVETLDGQEALSEAVAEFRHPVEWRQPLLPGGFALKWPVYPPMRLKDSVFPTTFETNNLGATLKIYPTVAKDGRTISATCITQQTALGRWSRTLPSYTHAGATVSREVPQFATQKSHSQFTAASGQWYLVGSHRLTSAPGTMTLHLVRFTTKPAPLTGRPVGVAPGPLSPSSP